MGNHGSRRNTQGSYKYPKYSYCVRCLHACLMRGYVQVCAPELMFSRACAGFGTDSVYLCSFQVRGLACSDFLNLIKHTES